LKSCWNIISSFLLSTCGDREPFEELLEMLLGVVRVEDLLLLGVGDLLLLGAGNLLLLGVGVIISVM
jgi:hypothetical protein